MERQNRRMRYGKALIVFLVVIVVCTVVSRAADAVTIPKVRVQRAESGRITYRLKGNGTVEPAARDTFLLPEGCLVEECLENGTAVKEGDVLVRFQMEYLEKRKEELERAFQEASLSLAQAELNQQEDAWIPATGEAKQTLDAAQAELGQAEAARDAAQKEVEQAEAARDAAEAELGQAEAAGDAAQNGAEQPVAGSAAREGTAQDLAEAEQPLEEARQHLAEAEQRLESARQAVSQAQQGYRSAEQSDAVTRQNNEKAKKAADLSVESARLGADTARQRLEEAERLLEAEGRLVAREAGIFLNPGVTAGTVTSGSELMGIGTGSLVFTAKLSTSEQDRLELGDEITVKLPGKEKIKAAVTELTVQKEAEGGQEVLLLKAELQEAGEPAAGQASFSLEKKSSEKYERVLPLTALHQDSRGYYCLGLQDQSTILGQEQRAEEIRVTLLAQDEEKAAVDGAILPDTSIIVSSEKQVEPRDRVKVEE